MIFTGPFGLPSMTALAEIAQCFCEQCLKETNGGSDVFWRDRMNVCPACGNKRCPHVENHRFFCTKSNAPNQKPRMSVSAAIGGSLPCSPPGSEGEAA